jgi:hypothetical protein
MPHKDLAYGRFSRQRYLAEVRGIAFKFKFDEWVAWWIKHLGPNWMELRGNHADQFVMARKKDRGPYSTKNVECITASQNAKDGNFNFPHGNNNPPSWPGIENPRAILTEADVLKIRSLCMKKQLLQKDIASMFGVSIQTISAIHNRVCWKHI